MASNQKAFLPRKIPFLQTVIIKAEKVILKAELKIKIQNM